MLTKLYPHQQNAVDKLKHVKVGALYMEQGTGAVLQTTTYVKAYVSASRKI